MTTLNKALRDYEDGDQIKIAGKLVYRDGNAIEANSFKTVKSHIVYKLFNEGDDLILTCSFESLGEPNSDYSQAKSKVDNKWYLELNDEDEFTQVNYFHCFTDIEKFHNSWRPAKSIAATFVEIGKGPIKYGAGGMVMAEGYFVKLQDASNRLFRALVWKNKTKNRRYNFALDDCKVGDCVLLLYAREQDKKYRAESPSIYTVCTVYPPVVKSQCIGPQVYRALSDYLCKKHCSQFNPYGGDEYAAAY